jgi:hypothetical protein
MKEIPRNLGRDTRQGYAPLADRARRTAPPDRDTSALPMTCRNAGDDRTSAEGPLRRTHGDERLLGVQQGCHGLDQCAQLCANAVRVVSGELRDRSRAP